MIISDKDLNTTIEVVEGIVKEWKKFDSLTETDIEVLDALIGGMKDEVPELSGKMRLEFTNDYKICLICKTDYKIEYRTLKCTKCEYVLSFEGVYIYAKDKVIHFQTDL